MRKHYPALLLRHIPFLFFCFFGHLQSAEACGYDWVSECSSQVQLRINGTLDSFLIAACPSGFPLNGHYLGNLQTLSLANAKTITWESCQNNVSGVKLHYRVYEQGTSGGAWLNLGLSEDYNNVDGAYTTRYRSLPQETLLSGALSVGSTYVLEVFFEAQVDTIGDDFIPETSFYKNNGGQNYRLTFTYGGPAASPLLLLPRLTEPRCHNGSDGKISVSVYGNHTGIFYHWSNSASNFYEQNFIPAGNYGLTVTNAAGESASIDIALGQPEAIEIVFPTIQQPGCNNPGMASAQASGGAGVFQYSWSNGGVGPTASGLPAGSYQVTATDARQCTGSATVNLDFTGFYSLIFNDGICLGDTFFYQNLAFTQAGSYEFTLPGNNACDTLLQINLQVHDAALFFSNLPDTVVLGCINPVQNLCAVDLPQASFLWLQNGQLISDQACVSVSEGGVYQLLASVPNCLADKTITGLERQTPPDFELTAQNAGSSSSTDGAAQVNDLQGNAPFTFLWSNLATTPQISNLSPGTYCVTVTDQYGCSNSQCITVGFTSAASDFAEGQLRMFPNPAQPGAWVQAQLPVNFTEKPVIISWLDQQGRLLAHQEIPVSTPGGTFRIQIPEHCSGNLVLVKLQGENRLVCGKIFLDSRR